MREDGYVDIEQLVASYEYTEETPEEFEETFFKLIGDENEAD